MAITGTSCGRESADGVILAAPVAARLRRWPTPAAIPDNRRMGKPTTLSVQILGPFAVARDGVTVPAHELASRKGRTLLKLLVARRGAVVPADLIAETLWGDRPPADPDANLATLVSRLRSVVGADTIAGDRRGWRFAAGQRVVVDLDEAERLTAEAEARLEDEPALAAAAADQALELLGRGPVMADEPDADWAEPARREAERLAGPPGRRRWPSATSAGRCSTRARRSPPTRSTRRRTGR
jgi:DNA-binding winged helix-turn-helix (wHTH) protein